MEEVATKMESSSAPDDLRVIAAVAAYRIFAPSRRSASPSEASRCSAPPGWTCTICVDDRVAFTPLTEAALQRDVRESNLRKTLCRIQEATRRPIRTQYLVCYHQSHLRVYEATIAINSPLKSYANTENHCNHSRPSLLNPLTIPITIQ